jgi:outer membrane biosynthesis protein TonB
MIEMDRKTIQNFKTNFSSMKHFNIIHALIIAFICHLLFLLFFKTFAAVFLEPSRSLYEIKPPEKAIKFTLVEPQEEIKPQAQLKSEETSREERIPDRKREDRLIITPEGEVPLPREQKDKMVAKARPLPPPRPTIEELSEFQEMKPREEMNQSEARELFEKQQITENKADRKEEKRIPITRKDLLSDFFVKPPEAGSSNQFRGGLNLESGLYPNLTFETKDFNWTDYASAIYWAIWRSWHNRLYLTLNSFERWGIEHASASIEGVTGVTFVIEKNGNISEITPLFSSGIEPLDISAVDALREVVLPPLPPNFYKDRERVTAKFIAETDIKSMKHYLPLLKYYGYF